jgi:uncharacterized membrane protein YdbT with pleckstrin-like domain
MSSNITTILEPTEEIKWQGKISRKVLFFNLFISILLLSLFLVFLWFKGMIGNLNFLLITAVLIIFLTIRFFLEYVKEFYATNKRLIIKSGIIGTDYHSIYFTEIKTLNLRVDLIEKIFAVGTIAIDTGRIETVSSNNSTSTRTVYDNFSYLDDPYKVYQLLQNSLSNRQESLYSGKADLK